MKLHKAILPILMLLCCATHLQAQTNGSTIYFINQVTGAPVDNVSIINVHNVLVVQSDDHGSVILPADALEGSGYIIAFSPGYQLDTIRAWAATISLRPLSVVLPGAVISNRKAHRLLESNIEYVLDYNFIDSNVIALAYSGSNGGHEKLFLLDKDGRQLVAQKIPAGATAIFKSCVGCLYCAYKDRFYRIVVDSGKIRLREPHDIFWFPRLQQCELCLDSNLYYRIGDKNNFTMEYGVIMKGDTVLKKIIDFSEKDVANASNEEYQEILVLLSEMHFNEAAKKEYLRESWDKGSYSHLDIPIFSQGDTVVIIDYLKKRILYFNDSGISLGFMPMRFSWPSSQFNKIIRDEISGRFYLFSRKNEYIMSLQEVSMRTGDSIGAPVFIEKPFAQKIAIRNNDIFYLWQDGAHAQTMQLYKQVM